MRIISILKVGILSFLITLPEFLHAQTESSPEAIITLNEINSSIKIDGKLDEEEWSTATMIDAFTQREPSEGEFVSEKTEVRIMYDKNNLYIGFRCWDSNANEIIANVMRRDMSLLNNDCIEIYLDTYHDHRSAFCFSTNALGAQRDGIVVADLDELLQNWDWNGVWDNVSKIDSTGWTAEIAIPFKTLRFNTEKALVWGINFARYIPRKREEAYWSPILRDYGYWGKYRISAFGHLNGLQNIQHPEKMQFKPFALSGLEGDFENGSVYEKKIDIGFDTKYLITSNLTLDVTLNTDFAQVEADQERVNLTRFELFFPEKREFFLEAANIFRFGERSFMTLYPASVMFFSRRIGLSDDNELVPLMGGLRMTGKAGSYNIGLLNILANRTSYFNEDDQFVKIPRTNFSTVRITKDILHNSALGMIATNKQSLNDPYYNRSVGFDANIFLRQNTQMSAFIAKTFTHEIHNKDMAAYIDFYHNDDFLTIFASQNSIQNEFNPEMGFFPRTGIRTTRLNLWIAPRPGILNIRQLIFFDDFYYITDQQSVLESRTNFTGIYSEFETGAYWVNVFIQNYERLTEDFEIHEDVIIPIDIYRFNYFYTEFQSDRSKLIAGRFTFNTGGFFDGRLTGFQFRGDLNLGKHLTVNLEYDHNDVKLPAGNFKTNIVGTRIVYSFTPKMFIKPYLQWNSDSNRFIANILFNYIFRPGSDLFFVYNEEVEKGGGDIKPINRTFIVKFTYLFNI